MASKALCWLRYQQKFILLKPKNWPRQLRVCSWTKKKVVLQHPGKAPKAWCKSWARLQLPILFQMDVNHQKVITFCTWCGQCNRRFNPLHEGAGTVAGHGSQLPQDNVLRLFWGFFQYRGRKGPETEGQNPYSSKCSCSLSHGSDPMA